jgi:hypothetical protein
MKLFPTGIQITKTEHAGLLHIVNDPEKWLSDLMVANAEINRTRLINQWQPKLFSDPAVETLPAIKADLAALIFARPDYKTRLEVDAALPKPEPVNRNSVFRYNRKSRPDNDNVTLFPTGLDVADDDAACILAYTQDLEDEVLGALLGQINRGKKKMIAQYHPIILADSSVITMPATEDGLITMILARSDYQRLGG